MDPAGASTYLYDYYVQKPFYYLIFVVVVGSFNVHVYNYL